MYGRMEFKLIIWLLIGLIKMGLLECHWNLLYVLVCVSVCNKKTNFIIYRSVTDWLSTLLIRADDKRICKTTFRNAFCEIQKYWMKNSGQQRLQCQTYCTAANAAVTRCMKMPQVCAKFVSQLSLRSPHIWVW